VIAIDSSRLVKAANLEGFKLGPVAYVTPEVLKIIEKREAK